jgi:polygalacturonase
MLTFKIMSLNNFLNEKCKINIDGYFFASMYACDSIGSLGKYPDELPVSGIRVLRSTLVGTTNGLRIKSWPDKYPGSASDINFSGINMENVKNPIIIDQEYECFPDCKKKVCVFIFLLFNSLLQFVL